MIKYFQTVLIIKTPVEQFKVLSISKIKWYNKLLTYLTLGLYQYNYKIKVERVNNNKIKI